MYTMMHKIVIQPRFDYCIHVWIWKVVSGHLKLYYKINMYTNQERKCWSPWCKKWIVSRFLTALFFFFFWFIKTWHFSYIRKELQCVVNFTRLVIADKCASWQKFGVPGYVASTYVGNTAILVQDHTIVLYLLFYCSNFVIIAIQSWLKTYATKLGATFTALAATSMYK